MRKLSERQARNCEEAKKPRCRCRCGGALHGVKRGGEDAPREWYENLPDDDPHKIKVKRPSLIQSEMFPELEAHNNEPHSDH